MGQVYKARHKRMKREVALKVLAPQFVKDAAALRRFHREVEAAARLNHQNIVTAYDADEVRGTHYLVMEYVRGRDLSEIVKAHGPLSVGQAVNCVLQAARGLAYAHGQGVIHRDIKPSNLLLDNDGTIKILDMGLARIDATVTDEAAGATLTGSGVLMGTVNYMSPEQAMDSKTADHRSDIYSLGCTLYRLLSETAMYADDTMMKRIMAHQTAPIPKLPVDDPALQQLFERMVAKQADDRIQPTDELVAALEAWLNEFGGETSLAGLSKTKPSKHKSSGESTHIGSGASAFMSGISELPGQEQTSQETTTSASAFEATVIPDRAERDVVPEQTDKSKAATEPSGPDAPATDDLGPTVIESSPVAIKVDESETYRPRTSRSRQSRSNQGPPWWKNRLVQLGGLGGFALLLGIIFLLRIGKYDVQITLDDPTITLSVDGEVLNITDGKNIYKLSAGPHKLQLVKDGFKTQVEEFTVTKDCKTAVTVAIVNGKLDALQKGEKPQDRMPPQPVANSASANNGQPSGVTEPPSSVTPSPSASSKRTSLETALRFSKRSDEVTVPTLFDDTDALTIEVWLRLDDKTRQSHSFIAGFGVSSGIHTKAPFDFPMGNHDAVKVSSESLKNGATSQVGNRLGSEQPVHVAGVRDPEKGETRLYFDGVLMITKKGEFHRGDGVLEICSADYQWVPSDGNDIFAFNGWLDEIRISKSVRYQQDFKPQRRFEKDNETTALYHFDEGTGDVLKDSSGNGHDGKIVGAKWVK